MKCTALRNNFVKNVNYRMKYFSQCMCNHSNRVKRNHAINYIETNLYT